MKLASAYWAATVLAVAIIRSAPAEACGYHDPSLVTQGVLNWVYPRALYVGTAVWRAEASGVLPKRAQTPAKDLFAYQRTVTHLQTLGERLGHAEFASGQGASFSMVLLDSMLWTRFANAPEGYVVEVHTEGPAAGDVVLVTHGKVIQALVEGSLDAAGVEAHGLVRFYGPAARRAEVRTALAALSAGR